jgi:hypothetical protein
MRFTFHVDDFGIGRRDYLTQENFSAVIDKIKHGAIDMHVSLRLLGVEQGM